MNGWHDSKDSLSHSHQHTISQQQQQQQKTPNRVEESQVKPAEPALPVVAEEPIKYESLDESDEPEVPAAADVVDDIVQETKEETEIIDLLEAQIEKTKGKHEDQVTNESSSQDKFEVEFNVEEPSVNSRDGSIADIFTNSEIPFGEITTTSESMEVSQIDDTGLVIPTFTTSLMTGNIEGPDSDRELEFSETPFEKESLLQGDDDDDDNDGRPMMRSDEMDDEEEEGSGVGDEEDEYSDGSAWSSRSESSTEVPEADEADLTEVKVRRRSKKKRVKEETKVNEEPETTATATTTTTKEIVTEVVETTVETVNLPEQQATEAPETVEDGAKPKLKRKKKKPGMGKKKVLRKKIVKKPKPSEEPYKGKLANEEDQVHAMELHSILGSKQEEITVNGFPDARVMELISKTPDLCYLQYYSEALDCRSYPLASLCALGASRDTIRRCHELNPEAMLANNFTVGTPLHFACMYGANMDVLTFLTEMEPAMLMEMNEKRQVPLHTACANGASEEVVRYLVEKKMMACMKSDKDGMTALHLACSTSEDLGVVECLVKAYPLACVARNEAGQTPLHLAVLRQAPVLMLKTLLRAHDSALEVKDAKGMIPLHYAVSSPETDIKVIKLLLKCYPDSTICRTASGETPLQLAHKVNTDPDVLKLLYPNV
jgi:Ankyrin repeats (3 copies)